MKLSIRSFRCSLLSHAKFTKHCIWHKVDECRVTDRITSKGIYTPPLQTRVTQIIPAIYTAIVRVADLPGRHRLRSSSSHRYFSYYYYYYYFKTFSYYSISKDR